MEFAEKAFTFKENANGPSHKRGAKAWKFVLVAGAGFEPTTSGL